MSGVEHVSYTLKCRVCGRQGEIVIEEEANPCYGQGSTVQFLSKRFKRAPERDQGFRFGVVCGKCKVEAQY